MIELRDLSKNYGTDITVVKKLNLTIKAGEIVILIGESGCGKTTTLQMINRLIEPSSGTILIDGVDTKTVRKSTLRRSIGYVIQDVGLLPHKTVFENIEIVPRLCKKNRRLLQMKVKELMDLIDLSYDEYATRYPNELSGGQQQRVGVARALANDPEIILMDEPFSALDPITREQLQDELLRLNDELQKTIVFVTHDIDEAITLGDKIAIMQDGHIIQFDTPANILKSPANDFVSTFIGRSRLWKSPDLLTACDVMSKHVTTINPARTVAYAKHTVRTKGAPVLVVTKKDRRGRHHYIGLIGLNQLMHEDDGMRVISEIVRSDDNAFRPDVPLPDIIKQRDEKDIRYSPIVGDNQEFFGLISNTSIINVLSDVIPHKGDE